MANTTNFGWETPDDTDLVKDGAAAMRTLGNSIDASFVDLKGGTTGQVLAKASNTDLDFVWSADAAGISPTIFDAKGDLIAASAADTAARLPVGTNGQVLTADSAESSGLKWATPAGGKILQVVHTAFSTYTTVTSTSFTNLFSATITPSSTSSKVLVLCWVNGVFRQGGNSQESAWFNISLDTTQLQQFQASLLYTNSSVTQWDSASNGYLDSPASTSALTYRVRWRSGNGDNVYMNGNSSVSNMILMEVGA